MSNIREVVLSEVKLNNPVAVTGFPTAGLVGSILAAHMHKMMNLPVIGGYTSPDLPPYAFVYNGRICPQIRVMAGTPAVKRKKGVKTKSVPKKDRRDVVVITTEIAPKPEMSCDLAHSILDTLQRLGVKDLVCFEGVGGIDTDGPVVCIPGSEKTRAMAEENGIEIMDNGIVRGISGSLMLEASLRGLDSMSLVIPASIQTPDPGAAARFIGPLSAMYPALAVDDSQLIKEADVIAQRLQAGNQPEDPTNIYGRSQCTSHRDSSSLRAQHTARYPISTPSTSRSWGRGYRSRTSWRCPASCPRALSQPRTGPCPAEW